MRFGFGISVFFVFDITKKAPLPNRSGAFFVSKGCKHVSLSHHLLLHFCNQIKAFVPTCKKAGSQAHPKRLNP